MNWAFAQYEELSRSRMALSTEAEHPLDLINSSYPIKPHSLIANYLTLYKTDISLKRTLNVGTKDVYLRKQLTVINLIL